MCNSGTTAVTTFDSLFGLHLCRQPSQCSLFAMLAYNAIQARTKANCKHAVVLIPVFIQLQMFSMKHRAEAASTSTGVKLQTVHLRVYDRKIQCHQRGGWVEQRVVSCCASVRLIMSPSRSQPSLISANTTTYHTPHLLVVSAVPATQSGLTNNSNNTREDGEQVRQR